MNTKEGVENRFRMGSVIGYGTFSCVKKAEDVTGINQYVAIKQLRKGDIRHEMHLIRRELQVIRRIEHENIVNFYDIYEDEQYFYLAMEFWNEGNLNELLGEKGKLKEKKVKKILKQILDAVAYLHDQGISHRDLKPDNILFHDGLLKIGDFGLSRDITSNKMASVVGTPYYVAPEVIKGKYGSQCDMWSIGVIMFNMITGVQPFHGDDMEQVFRAILKGRKTWNEEDWSHLSDEWLDLQKNLLQVKTNKRLTAKEALQHKWFNQ